MNIDFLQDCSNEVAGDASENVFNVIDAFSVPRLTYSVDRKKFIPDKQAGLPEAKIFPGNFPAFSADNNDNLKEEEF